MRTSLLSRVLKCRPTLSAIVCGIALTGCWSSVPMAPVKGTVTLDGKPLEILAPLGSGTVTFIPTTAEQLYAYGDIGMDGTFVMQTPEHGEGAVLGKYTVMIDAGQYVSDDPEAALIRLIPFAYSLDQSSGLTAEVKEGENQINFELSTKKTK